MSTSAVGSYNTVAVGTSATLIRPAKRRGSVLLQNVHATQLLYVGSDSSVAAASGIRVAAAGGSIVFTDYMGPLWGISDGAGTDVRYFEVS